MTLRCFPIPESTIILATGVDASKILHNLCTNEVRGLLENEGREAFFTNVKGRTVGHGQVYRAAQGFILFGLGHQSDRLLPHFDRYVITEKVEWTDWSESHAAVYCQGDSLREAILGASSDWPESPILACGEVKGQLDGSLWFQVRWLGGRECVLIVPKADREACLTALGQRGMTEMAESEFTRQRVLARWPWYGIDFSEDHLPQELDRDASAISFIKGCYLGQETVARLDALGQVQKRLRQWRFPEDAHVQPGMEIVSQEKPVAKVSTVARDESSGEVIALAMTRRSHFDAGSTGTTPAGTMGTVF